MKPFRIVRFESYKDPQIAWVIPEADYEWQSQSQLRTALARAVGRDYAVDLLGFSRAPYGESIESVRCTIVAPDPMAAMSQWMDIQRTLELIGRGKLVAELPDETTLWADARVRQPQNYTVSAYSWLRQTVAVQFTRLSPWWESTERESQWGITSSGHQQDVTIGGTMYTPRVTIRVTASSTAGYASPRIIDMTSGSTIEVGVTAPSSGAILEIDAYRQVARQSTDGGTNWTDVSSSVSIPAWQVSWFELLPGVARIRYEQDSAPNVTMRLRWVNAYA